MLASVTLNTDLVFVESCHSFILRVVVAILEVVVNTAFLGIGSKDF
ncbi:14147_t:CDS:2 [Dentiscutata erythropus]|uniref:14147_t:CDS:1 n=1 Tax=Dentiscutata erythropus TaxID=1348616 RepID=A0A9N9ITU3_9GLOM|nr:14147_t:CDS:2 [Dentiscutata erythropus]